MKIPKLNLHFHKFITVKIMNNYECCVCAKCHKKKVMNVTEGLHLPDESYRHWLNEKNFVPSNPEGFIFYSNYFKKYAIVTNYTDARNWFFSFLDDRMIKYKARALPEELIWLEEGEYENILRWYGKVHLD